MTGRDAIITRARELRSAWDRALADLDGTPARDQAEQDAYDDLIEYLEANNLNASEFDPRPGFTAPPATT